MCLVFFYCIYLRGGAPMEKVRCCRMTCLNNRDGVCTANAIGLDEKGRCMDCVYASALSKQKCARVHRSGGRYKQNKGVIK